ncbi:MAG: LacI family transcriptional regulator [Abditibacteriales bacterium]|nr:LacI family transcriptional regulator [Abditibacteriales bacterium]
MPHRSARALRNGRTHTIGVLTADTHQVISVLKIEALHREIAQRGYDLHLLNQQQIEKNKDASLLTTCYGAIEGLVLVYVQDGPVLNDVRALMAAGVPVVSLEHVKDLEVDVVTADYAAGAYQATRYLLQRGRAPVGLVLIGWNIEVNWRREAGYRRAVEEAGLEPMVFVLPPSKDSLFAQGYRGVERALDARPRPASLLFPDDEMAVGALRCLKDEGIPVPEVMAVIGWDNLPLCDYVDPRLSSLTAPVEETVALAIERLFARLNGDHSQPAVQLVQPELVVRHSCGGD